MSEKKGIAESIRYVTCSVLQQLSDFIQPFSTSMVRREYGYVWFPSHLRISFLFVMISHLSYRYRCSFDIICIVSVRIASKHL